MKPLMTRHRAGCSCGAIAAFMRPPLRMPAQFELEAGLLTDTCDSSRRAGELPDQVHDRFEFRIVVARRRTCRQHRIDLAGRHGRAQQELLVGQLRAQPPAQLRNRGHARFRAQLAGARQRLDAVHHVAGDRHIGPAEAADRIADDLVRESPCSAPCW